MNLFKKNKDKEDKPEVSMAQAPEESETPGETKHIKDLDNNKTTPKDDIQYREIPVFLSQDQINNMTIETNMIVKEILSRMTE